ncbi:hypothetical protein DPMN_183377 [Dreissena polymorpha]|uniref:Uncharacterized protein n=1 Tax=Dreissena polymorpha TaxID=45954 RepID=A0A9D4DHB5_DREPO|nr:hypothetical protein DPMN_183377 [Dreissena polymorpha]
MDFRVFQEVKSQLRGIRFASKQELTVAAKRIVSSFDADWYRDTFDKWISRHIKCIRVGGRIGYRHINFVPKRIVINDYRIR